jgi:hypothetical protein
MISMAENCRLPRLARRIVRLALLLGIELALNLASIRLPAQAPAQPVSPAITIGGVVVSTVTGKPIVNALVKLANDGRSMLTDDAGHFTFSNVTQPTEVISARKPGFLQQLVNDEMSGLRSLTLMGKDIDLKLALMPEAVIAGQIRNGQGEPVKLVQLTLLRRIVDDGELSWQAIGSAKTNAEGAFRIPNLNPGRYYLRTETTIDPDAAYPNEHTRNTDVDRGYVSTWYPHAAAEVDAQPIVVAAGDQFTANFTLPNLKFQPVSVACSWPGMQPNGSAGSTLYGPHGVEYGLLPEWDQEHQLFHFFAPPGKYSLSAAIWPHANQQTGEMEPWQDGRKDPYLGTVEFTVADAPVELPPMAMQLQEPLTIPIHVRFDFTQQDRLKAAITQYDAYFPPDAQINLIAAQADLQHSKGQTIAAAEWRYKNPEEHFEFKDVVPGVYKVQGWSTDGGYTAALTCGSTDLLRQLLVVKAGSPACSIEALLRDDSASVDVVFTAEAQAALKASGLNAVSVSLIPLDNPVKSPLSTLLFGASDPAHFQSVSPGDYLVVVPNSAQSVSVSDPPVAWRDPEVMNTLKAHGKVLTLKAGEKIQVQLDWWAGK